MTRYHYSVGRYTVTVYGRGTAVLVEHGALDSVHFQGDEASDLMEALDNAQGVAEMMDILSDYF